MDLNNNTFLATFGNDQDYLRALTGGPWMILDHYLVVHQWSPSFRTSDKPHRSVGAWIQLPELPVHFYHREVLFALGNLIGRTIKLDYHTEHMERGKFARIAVELDMSKPLPTRIWLDGFWQQVLYENLPTICYGCGRIGHEEISCPERMITPTNAIIAIPDSNPTVVSLVTSPEPPAGYGPWMQVTRKTRRHNRKGTESTSVNGGNLQGNRVDSGRISTISKGKTETPTGKSKIDIKGKGEDIQGAKKGNSNIGKGKLSSEGVNSNGNKKIPTSQEWRVVGQKEIQSAESNKDNKSSPTTSPKDPSTSGSKSSPAQQRPSPSNTTIRVIPVPPLETHPKENVNPNLGESSVRHHYPKKQSNRSPGKEKHKGVTIRNTKKPLQIRSPPKRDSMSKARQPQFPVTMNDIEEFLTQSQRKLIDTPTLGQLANSDIAMKENDLVERVEDPTTQTEQDSTSIKPC
ncbi:unnamed protein product [Linum trigynum]